MDNLINNLDETNTLKTNLKKKLSAVYSVTNMVNYVQKKDVAERVEKLGTAIRGKKRVILRGYESAHSKEVSDRYIEPFEFTTNCIDIWAYDLEKQDNRVFKISRITNVEVLEEGWTCESSHKKSITDCFRMSGYVQTPIKLELGLQSKNLLLEEYPLAEKDLKYINKKWILETLVSDMAGVGRFVIGLAHDIKVIESPLLTEYIHNFISSYFK